MHETVKCLYMDLKNHVTIIETWLRETTQLICGGLKLSHNGVFLNSIFIRRHLKTSLCANLFTRKWQLCNRRDQWCHQRCHEKSTVKGMIIELVKKSDDVYVQMP